MKRYVKINWRNGDHEVPRIMQLHKCIDIDDDFREILEARGNNKILSIREYKPKSKYLILSLGVANDNSGQQQTLILALSDTYNHTNENATIMLKNFGKFEENELIFDEIRIAYNESLLKEEGDKLYFQEFMTDCRGQLNSILGLIIGLFQCSSYYLNDKTNLQALTQTNDN